MSRVQLLALSVLDCVFGLIYLYSDGAVSNLALGLNFVLAALLVVLTYQDLRSRGWSWPAAASVTYLIAPLIGLVLYAALSNRPKREAQLARS